MEILKKVSKGKTFLKLTIFLLGLSVGTYLFWPNLFPKITVAYANDKVATGTRALSPQAQNKIYLGTAPIKVIYENRTWIATQNEVRQWINLSASSISVNPERFVRTIADQINVSATGEKEGRAVDQKNLTNQLNEVLASGRPNRIIALAVNTTPRGSHSGNYNGRYIDINLSQQTLYAFDNNSLVKQFLVSTGRRGYETPTGEFHVYGRSRSAKMSGPGYYLPKVPYISWFSGDYSIHGTYWHHNFGHVMSHGCVNAATPDAEWVYNFVETGTPVNIHY